MFQPRVKYEFVRRYCPPSGGWTVFVDIDPSEEGLTGGRRATAEAERKQAQMRNDSAGARDSLCKLGATVGGNRAEWFARENLPQIYGDRDIIAFNRETGTYLIAEVEGSSSGQPEQKLYKAIGQIVMAASAPPLSEWKRRLVVVVHGAEITKHLEDATALSQLGVSRLAIHDDERDTWLDDRRPDWIPSTEQTIGAT